MRSIIVGTAGHIDHGKTALVKALTGIDADRLEEEKRRGITIDLGFAHLDLPGPEGELLRLGFVDVPGHERFVRNMLAGVGGIDLVLLVIAADESIMPQTREHFDICRLLAVKRGIAVLTKADLVDPETLDVVKLEVEEFLRAAVPMPVIAVSSRTGAGFDDLKTALVRLAAATPTKDSTALARLPIDRVFTMKGFGTVVTGTLISGTLQKEEELEIFPTRERSRVRGLQVHGQPAAQAVAGQRTALNLTGIPKESLSRGMVLAEPGVFEAAPRIDVSLSLLSSAKTLKNRARVHLHAYTWEGLAEVAFLQCASLKPGETQFAQLRLSEPALLLPGDRFIIRQFSPVITIGGGVVLDAAPLRKKLPPAQTVQFLQNLAAAQPRDVLDARIARSGKYGLSISAAVRETGWRRERILSLAAELSAANRVARSGDFLLSAESWREIGASIVAAVAAFQGKNPLVPGIGRESLREQLNLPREIFDAACGQLAADAKLESSGDLLRLPGRGVVMAGEEAESKQLIEGAFAAAGLKVPALREVLAGIPVDRARAHKIVTLLLRDKILIKVSGDLVFHREALTRLRQLMAVEKQRSPLLDVARFKELTGVSRKYAIPLLEYLDRERITRREGDQRIIL